MFDVRDAAAGRTIVTDILKTFMKALMEEAAASAGDAIDPGEMARQAKRVFFNDARGRHDRAKEEKRKSAKAAKDLEELRRDYHSSGGAGKAAAGRSRKKNKSPNTTCVLSDSSNYARLDDSVSNSGF